MYLDLLWQSFKEYAWYLGAELLHPHWGNYVYWLLGLSLAVYLLELAFPWRKDQPQIRQDFWVDGFYLFFNFFLFSLIGFYALSNVAVHAFQDFLAWFGIKNLVALEIGTWPVWAQLLTLFVLRDFIHWNVHRLLHRVPWLWEFHKVHHSVHQMGFAAHLRFHWMENVIYRTLEYVPLAMVGFGLQDFFLVHIVALSIGHLNHANIVMPMGPLKYIFNNPQMHIWHHAKQLPHKHGANFGISLSVWDYLFKTAYMPADGRDIELGFEESEHFPKEWRSHMVHGFAPSSKVVPKDHELGFKQMDQPKGSALNAQSREDSQPF